MKKELTLGDALCNSDRVTPSKLKRIRIKVGLSRSDLAERLGVNRSTIFRWETGKIIMPKAAQRWTQIVLEKAETEGAE